LYNNKVSRSTKPDTADEGSDGQLKYKGILQGFFLITGVSMLTYGAARGEAAIVLGKAIKLCLECVGIG
jgi:hypothetical protein